MTGRSTTRIVVSNTVWRFVAFGARTISGLVAVVLLARSGGPASLGLYQLALTLTMMVQFLAALGLTNFLSRELSRRPQDLRQWVEGGLFWSFVASVIVGVLLTLGTGLFHGVPQLVNVVFLASIALVFDVLSRMLFSVTWAWERMGLEAAGTAFQEICFVIGTVAALHAGGGVVSVMLAYLISRVLGAIAAWWTISRVGRALYVPRPHTEFWRPVLRRTIPFALDDGLSLTYIRVDTVLLGIFKGTRAVGLYQAGTNLVLYMNVLARMLNLSLYARMSKAWPDQPARLGRLRDASLRLLGAVSMPITVGSLLLAPRLIPGIYGPKFDNAVFCYQLLVLVIPIRMLGHTLGTALTAADGQTPRTVVVGAAAAANIALNLYFVPQWSYIGAAITTGITETGVYLAYAVLLRRRIGPSRAGAAVFVPGLACLPMAAALVATRHSNFVLSGLVGAAAYGAALLVIAMSRATGTSRGRPERAILGYVRAGL
jgi:O-antigen/teichoic acid export membrane protein